MIVFIPMVLFANITLATNFQASFWEEEVERVKRGDFCPRKRDWIKIAAYILVNACFVAVGLLIYFQTK